MHFFSRARCAVILLSLFGVWASPVQAQDVAHRAALFSAGANTESLPFWLSSNQFGLIDPRGANAGLRFDSRWRVTRGDWHFETRLDLVGRLSDQQTAHAHQAYGRISYGPFVLTGGLHEFTASVTDPTLSLGSTVWSANAAPMPAIRLDMQDYVSFPGTHDNLAFRGYLSHGWLGGHRVVDRPVMHEKALYLRGFSHRQPVQLFAGVIHNVMWGGRHVTRGVLPNSFEDYLRIFFVQGGGDDAPENEVVNVLGNTVGAYDFGITFQAAGLEGLVYRQFYIETGPALRFRTPWDGRWGISLRRDVEKALISGFAWEHVNMLQQGAQRSLNEPDGVDNYYNNVLYRSGWTHRGRSLGIPLIFTDGVRHGVINNILIAHHLGIEGDLPANLRYRAMVTFSRNYGADEIYEGPGLTRFISGRTNRIDQTSSLLEVAGPLAQSLPLHFVFTLAADQGDLFERGIGVGLSLVWSTAEHAAW